MTYQPTELTYMEQPHKMIGESQYLGFEAYEGKQAMILDKTLFYPQGGGQPYDQGEIIAKNGSFKVNEVRFLNGLVHHIGTVEGEFMPGEVVTSHIDAERRHLNARLHTAGHLIDEAVAELEYPWQATKGCSFPGQCSVEYEGELVEGVDYTSLIKEKFNAMVATGFETKQMFVPADQLHGICHFVLPTMPKDKPSRIAIVWGEKGIPCGGTHVDNISEVGPITIKKVKAKKGVIKVSYDLH